MTSEKFEVSAVTLTAAISGRKVVLRDIGVPAVLVFHSQDTIAAAIAVNEAVRRRYPLASTVMIASVVNLSAIPKLFHNIAEGAMRQAYQQATAALSQGLSPEEYIVILPDWDGAVTKAVGFKDVNKAAGVLVLDRTGDVVGVYQGDDPASAALTMLAKAGI